MQNEIRRYDRVGIGLISGLILPVVVFIVVYLVGEKDMPFAEYLNNMWHIRALVKIGSLCVFLNVALFWGFLYLKYERSARGVLAATILYALSVLISQAL